MKKILFCILLISTLSFKKKEIHWVAIGDSITYLNDHPDETDNRITKGYMSLITEKYPHIKYSNKGYNGWTSGKIATQIDQLDIKTADVYTIFLGTNDWWQGRTIGTIEDYKNLNENTIYGSFKIIISYLKNLNPKAKIILITPLQRGDFVSLHNFKNNAWGSYKAKKDQSLAQVVNAIIEVGKIENIPVVDLYNKSGITLQNMVKFKRLKDPLTGLYQNYEYPDYIGIPFDPEKDEYPYPTSSIHMTYDGLHPSDLGYKMMVKKLQKEFRNL